MEKYEVKITDEALSDMEKIYSYIACTLLAPENAYDIDEYYESIQMGLPALYYAGRENPPHPEIWIHYFLRMVQLYSDKVVDLQNSTNEEEVAGSVSFLKGKEKELLLFLIKKYKGEFTPIEVSKSFHVTNKTIINRLSVLVKNGFVVPIPVNERIRSYELSEFTKAHAKEIQRLNKMRQIKI